MILVDTSVLIGYLKGSRGKTYDLLDEIIDREIPFGINYYIYQELLQGAKDETEYSRLQEYLGSLPFYHLKDGKLSFEKAARMYFICRRRGITVRSSIGLLIAETAIENDLYLLHNDTDYIDIAGIFTELKLYSGTS